jgi:hypothetical protein
MSDCLNCGKQTETNQRTGKAKKYCDNKCANKYYSKEGRYRAKDADGNLLNPDWGITADKENERKQKKKEKYEWYKANWYTVERIAQEFDISRHIIHPRAKTAGIKPTIVGYNTPTAFWSPEDAKRITTINEQVTPIPEGYLTKPEAAQYLGWAEGTFQSMTGGKYGHPKSIEWRETHGYKSLRILYTKSDLNEWKVKVKKLRQENIAETKKRQAERRLQKEQEILQKQREFEEATKNLLTSKQAAEIMGYKTAQPAPHAKSKLTPIILEGHSPRIWYNKKEVLKAAKELEAEREEEKRLYEEKWKGYGNNRRVPLRKTDWTDDQEYEKKLKQRINEVGPSPSVKKHKTQLEAWNANVELMRLYEEDGIITKLPCKDCKEELPYWKFYVEFKSGSKRNGRRNECKACRLKRRQSHNKKPPRKKSKKQIFPTYFACGIKQSLGSRQKEYCEMSNALIWNKIEELLGYNRQEFVKHIESQFEPWMNWDNHGRNPTLENPKWQLDHVIPKSSFNYVSIEDEDFKRCWSLENLKPIGAFLNLIKSDKGLRRGINASYRKGLKSGVLSGIWTFLPYSIQDAREYFEKQFVDGMNWDNYGKLWEIEHIIPQAALPYTSTSDINFKKCWGLENLKPLTKTRNCAKGSKYNNKIHIYNDV